MPKPRGVFTAAMLADSFDCTVNQLNHIADMQKIACIGGRGRLRLFDSSAIDRFRPEVGKVKSLGRYWKNDYTRICNGEPVLMPEPATTPSSASDETVKKQVYAMYLKVCKMEKRQNEMEKKQHELYRQNSTLFHEFARFRKEIAKLIKSEIAGALNVVQVSHESDESVQSPVTVQESELPSKESITERLFGRQS